MSDMDMLRGLNGVHVGLLDEDEIAALDRLCASGKATREYSGAAGFLGLARVRIKETSE